MKKLIVTLAVLAMLTGCSLRSVRDDRAAIEQMVQDHARAWETGDRALLDSLLHEEAVFAYPGRRLNKTQTLEDLDYFAAHFSGTKVYIHKVITDGAHVAVEWQFATTKKENGTRQVVSDAIIAEVKDGKFIEWKSKALTRVWGALS